MTPQPTYSPRERFWLRILAIIAFAAINGAFIYGIVFKQKAIIDALRNPIALALMGEAFVLLVVFAYLLNKWRVIRTHWGWFVFLSLLGSMAFALPVVLLWRRDISDST